VTAQKLALEKTPGLGSRIDISLTLIRIGFFFGDNALITENLAKAEKSVDFITPHTTPHNIGQVH
jgi:26S proteasome regulatory subunit N7